VARAAEFLRPTDTNIGMDQEQLPCAFYKRDEAGAQIANAPKRFGAGRHSACRIGLRSPMTSTPTTSGR
jgi:hypothetical protein